MDDAAGQPGDRREAQAEHHVADLGDAGVGEHALEVVLKDGHQRGGEHAGQGQHHEDGPDRRAFEQADLAEDGEVDADERVDRHLGRRRRQERGNHRGRVGVRVGQPHVQGKEGELEAQSDGQEGQRHEDGAGVRHRRQAGGEVGHVQGPGHHVHHAHPDDVEGGADGSHDQVVVGGGQGAAVLAHADQHVGRERGDLEKHEQVEGVAGDGDAQQSGQAQQIDGVEKVVLLGRYLGLDAGPGVRQNQRADGAHQHQHESIDGVDPVLDAPGRQPAAHGVAHHPLLEHPAQQQDGDRQAEPAHRQGQCPGQRAAAQDHAEGPGD